MLIPASALQDVLRILSDYEGDVQITHDDQQVLFGIGEVEVVARLIEGNYPDYRKLIPTSFETTAKIDKPELTNIVKVTSLFARESAGSVVLSVDEPSSSIWIRAVASQLGENNATATVEATGNGSITLNSKYILDALSVLPGKKTTIAFNGKVEPAVFRDADDDSYTHIIMPLKS
ncbi:MAG: polymerase subunit beta [Patescibacteria group bacterium]|nr:polymerase subunit beta [Patescibacteria group bacterium]